MVRAKIYINGKLTGYCDNPEEFTKEMRDKSVIKGETVKSIMR